MAFCEQCGVSLNDGAKFCHACGAATTGEADVRENRAMAVIAYVPFLFLLPLLTGDHKRSPFVLFHTNQGAVLTVAFVAAWILITFFPAVVPIIGVIIAFILSPIIGIGWLVLFILGVINAINGTHKRLPLIGAFTIIK